MGCLIVTLASLAATLVAIGEPLPPQTDGLALELAWEAPQGCPDLATERAEIRRRVGDIGRTVPGAPIAAEGTIQLDPSGYRLLLRTRVGDTRGERVLTGENCRELATAAALVLALLVNPEAALSLDPEPGPAVPPPPPVPPSPEAPPSSVHRPSGFGCGLDAVLASGVLPSLAGGLVGRFFYQRGLVMAAVQVAGFLPQTDNAPVLPAASARFYRLESALEVCAGTSSDRRLGGMLCLGGAAVRLHGEGVGISTPGKATAYWWEGSLAAAGSLRVTGSVRLRLATELRGLGGRPDFVIVGLGSTYRPAPFNGRGTLGIDVLF